MSDKTQTRGRPLDVLGFIDAVLWMAGLRYDACWPSVKRGGSLNPPVPVRWED